MSIEVMKMALEALELYQAKSSVQMFDDAVKFLRQAIKQAEQQEPVAWMYVNEDGECEQIEYGPVPDDPGVTPLYTAPVDVVNMKRERVDETAKGEHDTLGSEWAECVKLPIVVHVRKQRDGETHISTREGITPVLPDDLIMRGVAGEEYPIGRELFERTYTFDTTPPISDYHEGWEEGFKAAKQEWVGLTDEEVSDVIDDALEGGSLFDVARALEAAIKRKNT